MCIRDREKAIAFPTDSRLLDVARRKLVLIAKRSGVVLRQTFEKEGRSLRRRAGGYAHARQYRRLRRVLKRQRTVLGRVMRDLERRLPQMADGIKEMATPVSYTHLDVYKRQELSPDRLQGKRSVAGRSFRLGFGDDSLCCS